MSQVLDYSAGFPGAAAIKRAGYAGAVRYIGYRLRNKCTTRGEFEDFENNQLGMALVHEGAATDWRGGFSAGQQFGRKARDHANVIGFSADRPIYMAIDQDVVKSGEFATMVEYLRGAGTSLGGAEMTGVYGEADVIDRARDAGVATWFWQTAAWSRGRRTSAHLFQHVGTVTVGGIACDINDVLTPDWGQHNAGDTMGAIEDLQARQVEGPDKVVRGALDALLQGVVWSAAAVHAANAARDASVARLDALSAKVDALSGALTDDEANLLAAVRSGDAELLTAVAGIRAGEFTAEQVEVLAARMRAGLGDEVAQAVGRRLIGTE